jgi:hypothetical protein
MQKNVGTIDRVIRAVAGLAIIGWGVATNNWLGAIGLIPLGTAAIGWCPGYLPFGIKTCKTDG